MSNASTKRVQITCPHCSARLCDASRPKKKFLDSDDAEEPPSSDVLYIKCKKCGRIVAITN